jgi:GNAT superfamily N-acetyltransferase
MDKYQFSVRRSADGEEAFFSKMGRFFASTAIRKEMGGSALSDLPHSLWLTLADESGRVVAFLLVEALDKHIRIKDGYVDPDHRGQKLLAALILKAVEMADEKECDLVARVRKSIRKYFPARQFKKVSESGNWISLEKKHVARRKKA